MRKGKESKFLSTCKTLCDATKKILTNIPIFLTKFKKKKVFGRLIHHKYHYTTNFASSSLSHIHIYMLNILDCIRHEVKNKKQIQIHLQNGTTSAHCIHKVNMQHIIFVQNQQASSLVKTGKYFIKSEICNIKILSKAIDKILPGIREELRCASPPLQWYSSSDSASTKIVSPSQRPQVYLSSTVEYVNNKLDQLFTGC